MRFLRLLLLLSPAIYAADAIKLCTTREIAFVDSFIGPWTDTRYQRALVKNLSVCADSVLVRDPKGKYSANDRLVLRDLFKTPIPAFVCASLLNCKDPIELADIQKKAAEGLKGKSFVNSAAVFGHVQTTQTSTLSRMPLSRGEPHLRLNYAVVRAGEPLHAAAVLPEMARGETYTFDLCPNAEKQDCGATLPQSQTYKSGDADLPFGKLRPGLNILYEVKTLPGDTVVVRTENRVFIVAADPSWPAGALDEIRTRMSLMLMDPKITAGELEQDFFGMGTQLAQPYSARPARP